MTKRVAQTRSIQNVPTMAIASAATSVTAVHLKTVTANLASSLKDELGKPFKLFPTPNYYYIFTSFL